MSRFCSRFGLEIERSGDHFTFADLVEAPDYSILGGLFLDMICTATFEGPPWEVMRENKLIYDFSKGLVVPLLSVAQLVSVAQAGHRWLAPGMILPGSVTDDGSRVTDYSAFYDPSRGFIYSEIGYGDLL